MKNYPLKIEKKKWKNSNELKIIIILKNFKNVKIMNFFFKEFFWDRIKRWGIKGFRGYLRWTESWRRDACAEDRRRGRKRRRSSPWRRWWCRRTRTHCQVYPSPPQSVTSCQSIHFHFYSWKKILKINMNEN